MNTQAKSDQPLIAGARAYSLESEAVGDSLTLFVSRCGVSREVPPQVTLYVTDGNANFGLATEIVRSAERGGILPPTLVVAIGYPDPRSGGVLRNRDLTPTANSGRGRKSTGDATYGRADALIEAITGEIQPWVDSTWSTPARTAYAGFSFGGLFGAWTLLNRPTAFDDYLIGSPSVWWDDELLLGVDIETTALAGRRAYVSIGAAETPDGVADLKSRIVRMRGEVPEAWAEEEPEPDQEPVNMVDVGLRFADRLREIEGFELHAETLFEEHHMTAMPGVLGRGLRWLYGDLAPAAGAG